MGFVLAVMACTVASARVTAQQAMLVNGGEVTMRRDGPILHVSLVGPRTGLASLCVGDATQVRILHASAAVGDALYEKADGGWKLKHGFTDPMTVSYWPNALDDDCKRMKIGQGHLPDTAQFKPETWTRIP